MTPYEISGLLAKELASDTAAEDRAAEGMAGKDGPANQSGEVLAPIPAVLSPLHELESSLLALLDTEDCVTPEQEQAFLQDLSETMQAVVAKRDRVGAFVKHCEGQAALAADEIRRLTVRKRALENAAERVRGYVLWIIEAMGPDDKGKLRKLEGNKFTFSTRKAKAKLEITDEAAVPSRFKFVDIDIPAEKFERYMGVLRDLFGVCIPTYSVDEVQLRAYLEGPPTECKACGGAGDLCPAGPSDAPMNVCHACGGSGVIPPSVPGAKLLTDRNSLVLR